MTDRYTAADFSWLADLVAGRNVKIEHPTPTIVRPGAAALTLAALQIASRVMAEGAIEGELSYRLYEEPMEGPAALAGYVRAALLEDAGT